MVSLCSAKAGEAEQVAKCPRNCHGAPICVGEPSGNVHLRTPNIHVYIHILCVLRSKQHMYVYTGSYQIQKMYMRYETHDTGIRCQLEVHMIQK